MSHAHERDRSIDDLGGEPLEDSGFETETPDPLYSEESDGFQSAKEGTHVQ